MSVKVNFRLPEKLVEKADTAAEITHKDRTEVVREALREYLKEIEDDEKFRETVVELYMEGEIEYETMKDFIGRQDAEAVKNSREILDRGEEIVEKLAEK